jgi:hypothetical protein
MRPKYLLAVAALALVVGTVIAVSASAGDGDQLSVVRASTAGFQNFGRVSADGRGEFRDAMNIACIDAPGLGAMGIHYVKGSIVGDGAIDAADPEAVIYEPQANGRMRLVAVEYVVFKADWDANHSSPPSLFGEPFNFTPSPNRYGLPPFYSLHAWLWKHNPSGMFAPWNPDVSCANA